MKPETDITLPLPKKVWKSPKVNVPCTFHFTVYQLGTKAREINCAVCLSQIARLPIAQVMIYSSCKLDSWKSEGSKRRRYAWTPYLSMGIRNRCHCCAAQDKKRKVLRTQCSHCLCTKHIRWAPAGWKTAVG